MKMLQKYKQQGKSFLDFNTDSPLMTDQDYDALCEKIGYSGGVGCPPPTTDTRRRQLPYYMGSLQKIKTEKQLSAWFKKRQGKSVHVTPKLDGVSVLIVKKDTTVTLFTRGDGRVGQDMTHLFPRLCAFYSRLKVPQCVLRGELILSHKTFMSHYEGRGNARNIVSGLVNSQERKKEHSHLDLVCYEVFGHMKPSDQYSWMTSLAIPCVPFDIVTTPSFDFLKETFESYRSSFSYSVDGLVLVVDEPYERVVDKNPSYAVAFKTFVQDQLMTTKVRRVEWRTSPNGMLKPRLVIDPVVIHGNTIEYVSAYNARYVETHRVGKGAIVDIVRSGDVIPILYTVRQGTRPEFPEGVEYMWNETKSDIQLKNMSESVEMHVNILVRFFKNVKLHGWTRKNAQILVSHQYTTPLAVRDIPESEWTRLFGDEKGKFMYQKFHSALDTLSLSELLVATYAFGKNVSKTVIERVVQRFPTLEIDDKKCLDDLRLGEKTTRVIWEHLRDAQQWMKIKT
jgi:DNA ligase (NAD+)